MSMSSVKKVLYYSGCMVVLVLVFGVMTIAASYTIYNTDDFSTALAYNTDFLPFFPHFTEIIRQALDSWFHWGGTYTGSFLVGLLNPLLGNGLLQMRIVMVCVMLLLLASMIFFVYAFFENRGLDKELCLALTVCFIWCFFNYKTWPEAVFWFTGAMCYAVPLSFFMIAYCLIEKWFILGKNLLYIGAAIFCFLAAGGSQAIAIAEVVIFFLSFCQIIKERKKDKKKIMGFSFIILIPLFNILAPGNFSRHAIIGDTHLLRSFFFSARVFVVETERLFKDTGFLLVLLILIGVCAFRILNADYMLHNSLFLWLTACAVSFIACLGYDSPFLPNRTLFVVDFFVIVGYISFAVMIGAELNRYFVDVDSSRKNVLIFGGLCIVIMSLQSYRIEDGYIYKLGKGLYNNEIQTYYSDTLAIFDDIEQSDTETVHINGIPKPVDGFVELWVAQNEDDYKYLGNIEIAAYYGKREIVVED